MRLRHLKSSAIFSGFFVGLTYLQCGCAWSPEQNVSSSGVVYQHIVRSHPILDIHVVTIDLSDAGVSVRVARGGPDPDDDGPWTTTLEPVREIAAREGFDIAINGDFFIARGTRDIEGRNTAYVRGRFATPVGMAMTDGRLWHRAARALPFLAITTNHSARFGDGNLTEPLAPDVCQILTGSQMIVSNGLVVDYTSRFATRRNPRTAAGLDRTGTRLTLMVVDGRQPKRSIGMTLHELSNEMIRVGCYSAINLDGGGSSTMLYRNSHTQRLKAINSPSDTRERPVADVLGVTVRGPMPAAD